MKAQLKEILGAYIEKLKAIYRHELSAVILYGSYARDDYTEQSDIDMMILLDADEKSVRQRNESLVFMTYDFNMEHDVDIQPVAERKAFFDYWTEAHPFYKNVKREGVVLYHAA